MHSSPHDTAGTPHTPDNKNAGSAVVCGGGVAGIAAAVKLAQAGVAVTLVESLSPGNDGNGGDGANPGDPKKHHCRRTVTRAHAALRDLYRRLGVGDRVAWSDTLYFADPEQPGRLHEFKADDLPAPMHLFRAMLRFGLLDPKQKFAAARAVIAAMQVGSTPTARASYNDISFRAWLGDQRQSRDAIARFWSPVIAMACNETPEGIAAGYALGLLQDGLFSKEDGYHFGQALCPLEVLLRPATEVIENAGGRVMVGTAASGFTAAAGRITGLALESGETLTADHYLAAVPLDRVASLLPDDVRNQDERFANLDDAQERVTLGVDLYYRTPNGWPVMEAPQWLLPTRPVWRLLNSGAVVLPEHGEVQHVYAEVTATQGLTDQSDEDLVALADAEVHRLVAAEIPGLQRVDQHVVRTRRTAFSLAPGAPTARPGNTGVTENLLVAGDWTDTAWPATPEGAARSGYAAAAAILGDATQPVKENSSLLYRLLAS